MAEKSDSIEDEKKTSDETLFSSPYCNLIAGAGSGISASIYTCPLDTIKTRIQNGVYLPNPSGSHSHHQQQQQVYKGTLNSLVRIFKEEGVRGWYRGFHVYLLGYIPSWAIYFACYQEFKNSLTSKSHQTPALSFLNPVLVNVLSAIGGGCISTSLTQPLWVIRTRLIIQSKASLYYYNSITDAFYKIHKYEGFKGFYKGFVPSLLGTCHVAIQFPCYEYLKTYLSTRQQNRDDNAAQHNSTPPPNQSTVLFSAIASKVAACLITYPHEVVRTRLQNQSTELNLRYKGFTDAVFKIYLEEGYRGFYKGLATNFIKIIPSTAFIFLTYESLYSAIKNKLDYS